MDVVQALQRLGVDPIVEPGWETRGRDELVPVGVMGHHDAISIDTSNARRLEVARDGTRRVPGPLYGLIVQPDATVHVVAGRRCNHAGLGMADVLDRTVAGEAPAGRATEAGTVNGNGHYRSAMIAGGLGEHMEPAQSWPMIDRFARCVAAWLMVDHPLLCVAHPKRAANLYVAHAEWTSRKVDPYLPVGSVRESVARVLADTLPPTTASGAGTRIRQPVAVAHDPRQRGYWITAADGGVFTEGTVGFFGSMGGSSIQAPIVDIVATLTGEGYWLLGADGGVFAFGDARFPGSGIDRIGDRTVVGGYLNSSGRLVLVTDEVGWSVTLD